MVTTYYEALHQKLMRIKKDIVDYKHEHVLVGEEAGSDNVLPI